GMADHPRNAVIPTTAAEGAWLAERLRQLKGSALKTGTGCREMPVPHFQRILAIHAGAGWATKRWPVEKFAEIARRFEGPLVVVGSADEERLAGRVIEAAGARRCPVLNLAGQTTLKQLAALLEIGRA